MKKDMPGAAPKLQGRWGYIEGLDRPNWCKGYHDQLWWQEEYQAGWDDEKRLDEQRKSINAPIE